MLLSGCLRWLGFGTWVWGGVGEEFKEFEERRGSNGVMVREKCLAVLAAFGLSG
jgi:hypothetical protein